MTRSTKRNRRNSRAPSNNNNKYKQQALVAVPRGPLIPSSAKRIERLVARYSGANFTIATTTSYAYFAIDSSRITDASPWTQLSALYQFVRPIALKATITAVRSTGTSDNPFVSFVPTPDGQVIGSAAMNLNTFESPTSLSKSLGPGQEVTYVYQPYIAVAAYNTPSNGYIPMKCPRVSINSLPRVYFGEILLSTPGVNVSTTANYIQLKLEYVMEFDTIDVGLVQ